MNDRTERYLKAAEGVINGCRQQLRGHRPTVQGAALADLVATWLAGHFVAAEGQDLPAVDEQATRELRELALEPWLDAMWKLVPIAEEHILKTLKGRQRWDAP